VALHLASLVTARLRSPLFRALVSIPGLSFAAAGALAGPWLLALLPVRATIEAVGGGTGIDWLAAVPFALVAVSLVTTCRPVAETVRITLDDDTPASVRRLPLERHRRRPPPPATRRPLRLVQIADPHLGPWQSVAALRGRIERLLAHEPDLVLLTGDFLTMEGQGTPGALAQALAPLRRLPGRCFGVLGNHDHESPHEVSAALAACGVTLLVDDETTVETEAGSVQLVGADWVGRG
jgi:hypothetical protein